MPCLQSGSSAAAVAGFTLIELLVVIAIIAVLIALLLLGVQAGPRGRATVAMREQPEAGRSRLHNYESSKGRGSLADHYPNVWSSLGAALDDDGRDQPVQRAQLQFPVGSI